MPVDAVKLMFFRGDMDFQLLWLPTFEPGIMPADGSPWVPGGPDFSEFSRVDFQVTEQPDKTLINGELGGKASVYLPGVDVSISSLYTWNDFPVSHYHISADTIRVSLKHHRYGFIGATLSASVAGFVLRSESAFYFDERFEKKDFQGSVKRNAFAALIGMDWYPGNEWTLSAQLSDDMIIGYQRDIKDEEHSWLGTLNISKTLARNTIELSSFTYLEMGKSGLFNRSSIDYALTDQMHFLSGIDIFHGDSGLFGQFRDNSEIWIKAKYSF
jgi:hypothetical protein